ncbi:MAG: LD-carboxypeptidase [Muribaculaceae bacterium]|nr:LD-carboxypeptidase [Muribaculaceae bacterium]
MPNNAPDSIPSLIVPRPMEPGSKIVILSPAGIARPQNVYNAMEVLRQRGWNPRVSTHALSRFGTYSGTDEERFADLRDALLDPEVRLILCSRGGYGAVHLLARLDELPLRDNAKWIVGFSDISALHALMHRHGIASIHGPKARHIASNGGEDDDSADLFNILEGRPLYRAIAPHPFNRTGEVEGTLVGGNLAVLAGLIGTPFDMLRPDMVLFIEDVSELVYKIERILYQLKLSGILASLRGLIVGQFTEYSPDADFTSMEAMIRDMVSEYSYPVAFNVPLGHCPENMPLMESMPVELSVDPDRVTIYQYFPAENQ